MLKKLYIAAGYDRGNRDIDYRTKIIEALKRFGFFYWCITQ